MCSPNDNDVDSVNAAPLTHDLDGMSVFPHVNDHMSPRMWRATI